MAEGLCSMDMRKEMDNLKGQFSASLLRNDKIFSDGQGIRTLGTRISTPYGKIKSGIPKFNGNSEDLRGWLFRSEQFFDVDETPMEAKVRLATVRMEGKTLQWHQVYTKSKLTRELRMWEKYIRVLQDRFGSLLYEDPMSELMNLTQTSLVKEYLERFDELLNNEDLT
ncbi:hypothetical protein BUALT_Bualt06G0054600 [Buddleja alternifolia]|uniref:Retrotransposon gag domain-containing protein n=1 Tax=Buddleja alternifolia TaxID=168488 RepID=A0AAV6XD08_9LAMI|nr:hypothetical protein BUALT_Bualt06G0054600 [Buddleja alternifolia]